MEKNWLIIGHGSLSDGYATVKKFFGTESDAKKALMNEIRKERKEAEDCGCIFDYGTKSVSELTNDKGSTNAAWYGYSVYDDHHTDFMLFDMGNIKTIGADEKVNANILKKLESHSVEYDLKSRASDVSIYSEELGIMVVMDQKLMPTEFLDYLDEFNTATVPEDYFIKYFPTHLIDLSTERLVLIRH